MQPYKRHIILVSIILFSLSCFERKSSYIEFSDFSPENNIALNRAGVGYPKIVETDDGWGGAFFKNHLIDGIRRPCVFWNYGFAFTGGFNDYVDTCGWRQLTIDFGRQVSFNRVVIWRNRDDQLPETYYLQYFESNTASWHNAKVVHRNEVNVASIKKRFFRYDSYVRDTWATEDTFRTVTSNKLRHYLNNCDVDVVWLYEIEVYFD